MIWISEPVPAQPPIVGAEARQELSMLFQKAGVDEAISLGGQVIKTRHAEFGKYIIGLGNELNRLNSTEWPLLSVKAGAALAIWAYHETGYYYEIDETALTNGGLLAALGGIPDTFLDSLSVDSGLADISAEFLEVVQLRDPGGGVAQVLDIGAGCTRHYLQQAILAA